MSLLSSQILRWGHTGCCGYVWWVCNLRRTTQTRVVHSWGSLRRWFSPTSLCFFFEGPPGFMIPKPVPWILESKLKFQHGFPSLSFGDNKLCWHTNAGLSGEICETTGFWKLKQADGSMRRRRDHSDGPGGDGDKSTQKRGLSWKRQGGECREKQFLNVTAALCSDACTFR